MRIAMRLLLISLASVQLALTAEPAAAQSTRTIKIIVPSTAGRGADTLARLLGDQISRKQGQTIVVENRPGASNTIGTEAVARAAPDGNTVLVTTPEFVINAHLKKLNYDPLTSFESICYLVKSPQIIVVNAASPYRTLAEFLNAARTKPGELTMASAGPASSPHIAIEALKHAAGVSINFIPYQGSTPAVNALLGEHVTAVMASYPNLAELIATGKLRALATASAARIEPMPNVPTVAESGFKDFESDIWFGLVAPAKTPGEATSQLGAWFTAALKDPEVTPKLAAQGLFPVGTCGADFAAFTKKQYDDYGRAIRDANIKAQ
jgi:tripartite-type tricarboxylate transporter receptor subunit TctC